MADFYSEDHGYTIEYYDPWGNHFDLYDADNPAVIIAGGITGLVGEIQHETLTVPTQPGQHIVDDKIPPMVGELTLYINGENQSVKKTCSELRAGFSPIKNGTLVIDSPTLGRLTTRVRLNGVIASPDEDPDYQNSINDFKIPIISDDGYWSISEVKKTGTVEIVNSGYTKIWPRIYWKGNGGLVTQPSGATFSLPASTTERVLNLNPFDSLIVTTLDGKLDETIWKSLWGVIPEGIEPGETGTYQLPTGAEIGFSLGVLDPWL